MLVSAPVWESIPPEDQEIFIECGREMDEYGFAMSMNHVEEEIERAAIEAPDFQITNDLTPEENKRLANENAGAVSAKAVESDNEEGR